MTTQTDAWLAHQPPPNTPIAPDPYTPWDTVATPGAVDASKTIDGIAAQDNAEAESIRALSDVFRAAEEEHAAAAAVVHACERRLEQLGAGAARRAAADAQPGSAAAQREERRSALQQAEGAVARQRTGTTPDAELATRVRLLARSQYGGRRQLSPGKMAGDSSSHPAAAAAAAPAAEHGRWHGQREHMIGSTGSASRLLDDHELQEQQRAAERAFAEKRYGVAVEVYLGELRVRMVLLLLLLLLLLLALLPALLLVLVLTLSLRSGRWRRTRRRRRPGGSLRRRSERN